MIAIGVVPDRRPRRARRFAPSSSARRGDDAPERCRRPAAPAGVRGGRRRPDRHRGDRDRRPGVQAARGEERGRRRSRSWPASSACCSSGITFLAVNFGITHVDLPEKQTVISQVAGARLRRRARSRSTCSRRSRRCCCSSPRTRASTRSRGSRAILAEDGFMPRQFAFRGDRLAFTLRDRRPRRRRGARSSSSFQRRDPPADPAVRGRRVHRLHDQPGRDDPALAARAASRAGGGGSRSTPSGCVLTGVVAVVVTVAEGAASRCIVIVLIPLLVGVMLLHPPPVRRPGGGARGPRRRA